MPLGRRPQPEVAVGQVDRRPGRGTERRAGSAASTDTGPPSETVNGDCGALHARERRGRTTPAPNLPGASTKGPVTEVTGPSRRSGDRIRTCDLWVMSPASYRAAPPRVGSTRLHGRRAGLRTTPVTAPSHRSQDSPRAFRARAPRTRATYSPTRGGGQRDGAASMFAGEPQPVEIHHRGIWYSGELLGWRHEGDGRVAARVRCVVDGLRHSTWKDLADLRLPDPGTRRAAERFPAVVRRPVRPSPEDEDDATRPHVLLAGDARRRPAKPNHAVTPPDRPAPLPVARPAQREAPHRRFAVGQSVARTPRPPHAPARSRGAQRGLTRSPGPAPAGGPTARSSARR